MRSAAPHHNLHVWQVSMMLVTRIYDTTRCFPKEELYGLTLQVRRCAVSIPSNIAEGAARSSSREFAYSLSVARGSLAELETQLLIAVALQYVDRDNSVFDLINRVARLLTGLHRRLQRDRVDRPR